MRRISASSIVHHGYELITGMVVKRMRLRPVDTGKITENLYAVKTGTVNFYVYTGTDHIICFDCGFGKAEIRRQLAFLGIDPQKVTHLFLTHSDFDHVGGLALFHNAAIYLSCDEEEMITRKRRRLGILYNSRIKRNYHLLWDGEVIHIGSVAVKAIATPGHTPGSMSYLLNDTYLFVGDNFRLVDGRVYPLKSYINMDTEKQKKSIRKLASIQAQYAFTGHSGYTSDFETSIQEWKE